MVFTRQLDDRFTRLRLHVGGIDHCKLATAQALAHDLMQQVEGIASCGLVVLVVGNQCATDIR
jgi:hypothetical protein